MPALVGFYVPWAGVVVLLPISAGAAVLLPVAQGHAVLAPLPTAKVTTR